MNEPEAPDSRFPSYEYRHCTTSNGETFIYNALQTTQVRSNHSYSRTIDSSHIATQPYSQSYRTISLGNPHPSAGLPESAACSATERRAMSATASTFFHSLGHHPVRPRRNPLRPPSFASASATRAPEACPCHTERFRKTRDARSASMIEKRVMCRGAMDLLCKVSFAPGFDAKQALRESFENFSEK